MVKHHCRPGQRFIIRRIGAQCTVEPTRRLNIREECCLQAKSTTEKVVNHHGTPWSPEPGGGCCMATCTSRKGFRPGSAPFQVVLDGGPKKPSDKLAKNALLRAHEALDYLNYHYKSMVEIGTLPAAPIYLTHRVKSALRAGREGMRRIWNVHTTIVGAQGLANYINGTRIVLLQFMHHHGAHALPGHLARFELDAPPEKRHSVRPVRTRHGPREN